MDKAELIEVLRGLGQKRGLSLWSLKPAELGLVLMSFAQTVGPDETFGERDFSARLSAWLGDNGDMLRTDFAELRRALTDLRFFDRDKAGATYRRAPHWPERWRAQCEAVDDVGLSDVLGQARRAASQARAARKQRALARV